MKTGQFEKSIRTKTGNLVLLEKESEESDWYITVMAQSGLFLYDGWWKDSSGKTWNEAFIEAKTGSKL